MEDDSPTTRIMSLILKTEGYVCDVVELGREGLETAKLYNYDLIILDLVLPDMDGYSVLRSLRSSNISTPVLILSGLTEVSNKIKGLGFGADDYLTKPFNKNELIARIQAIIRRSKGHSESVVKITDRLIINMDAKMAEIDGQPFNLTNKEYGALELLATSPGKVLTKEAFLNYLYGGVDEPEVKIIDVFICKLRKKLVDALKDQSAANYIETVWGRGYIMRIPPIGVTISAALEIEEKVSFGENAKESLRG